MSADDGSPGPVLSLTSGLVLDSSLVTGGAAGAVYSGDPVGGADIEVNNSTVDPADPAVDDGESLFVGRAGTDPTDATIDSSVMVGQISVDIGSSRRRSRARTRTSSPPRCHSTPTSRTTVRMGRIRPRPTPSTGASPCTVTMDAPHTVTAGFDPTTAPTTTFVKRPKKPWPERPEFELSASQAGSTFECRVDHGGWKDCESRFRLRGLDPGKHKLRARATNADGQTGPRATDRFRIPR